jgi:aminoacylase
MKCVCIQYIEAVGRLKKLVDSGKLPALKRTIHLSFLPDEEIGGFEGAKMFVDSQQYKDLNIGCALDEGLANPGDAYTVFYGERCLWWVKISATGPVGHGSRFIPRTAIEKLTGVLGEVFLFRSQQRKLLHPTGECDHGCDHSVAKKLGDVVTVNVTGIKGFVPGPAFSDGFAVNCIPPEAIASLDIRIPPSVPLEDMESLLKKWTKEEGLSYQFYNRMPAHYVTAADDSNPWWVVLRNSFETLKRKIEPEIFPAGTDSRYFRMGNLPCFGFSPIRNTPILLHDHNEYLEVKVFLEGIDVFERIVADLANSNH